MMDWAERNRNHAVHTTLQQFGSTFSSAEAKRKGTEQAPHALSRLRHVVDFAERTLSQADPLLLGTASLDAVNNHLNKVLNHVNQFAGDGNMRI